MKTLYFEGAGMATPESIATGVGNCRIRTAFHTTDGRRVYLELRHGCRSVRNGKKFVHDENSGVVDSAHYITNEGDDCNTHRIVAVERNGLVRFTPDGILDIVRKCGGAFDAIRVLPDLAGYRVFKEDRSLDGIESYNYGDDFVWDAYWTEKREQIKSECYRLEYEARKRDIETRGGKWVHSPSGGIYPNFSLWVPEGRPGVLCWHLCGGEWNGTHEIPVTSESVRACIKAATGWTDATYGDFSKAAA